MCSVYQGLVNRPCPNSAFESNWPSWATVQSTSMWTFNQTPVQVTHYQQWWVVEVPQTLSQVARERADGEVKLYMHSNCRPFPGMVEQPLFSALAPSLPPPTPWPAGAPKSVSQCGLSPQWPWAHPAQALTTAKKMAGLKQYQGLQTSISRSSLHETSLGPQSAPQLLPQPVIRWGQVCGFTSQWMAGSLRF